jgi:hypothetical protein
VTFTPTLLLALVLASAIAGGAVMAAATIMLARRQRLEPTAPRTDKLSTDEMLRMDELIGQGWETGEIAEIMGRSRPTVLAYRQKYERRRRQARANGDPVAERMAELETQALDAMLNRSDVRQLMMDRVQERLLERLGAAPVAAEPARGGGILGGLLSPQVIDKLISDVGVPLLLGTLSNQGVPGADAAIQGVIARRLAEAQAAQNRRAELTAEAPPDRPLLTADNGVYDPGEDEAPPEPPAPPANAEQAALDEWIAFMVELTELEPDAAAYRVRLRLAAAGAAERQQWDTYRLLDGATLQALADGQLGELLGQRPHGAELLRFIASEAGPAWWDAVLADLNRPVAA